MNWKNIHTGCGSVIGMVVCWLLMSANILHAQGACNAYFTYQIDGPQPGVGDVVFTNESTGDNLLYSWEFGDGGVDTAANPVHFYQEGGFFTVTLTIYSLGNGCASQFSETIFVTFGGDPCDYTDCVWPGDANADQASNYYDLLNISLGFGTSGPPRPNASLYWAGQPAPDWGNTLPGGINYKHLDCDGNGDINEQDLLAFSENYTAINDNSYLTELDYPPMYLEFEEDSIYVHPYDSLLEVRADLYVGSETAPAQQLFAIACHIDIPADLSEYIDHVELEYNDNSFFGTTINAMAAPPKQIDNQIDLGFARRFGPGANGNGKIATLKFIVIDDIISGRSEKTISMPAAIRGARAINVLGDPMEISVHFDAAQVTFVADSLTGVHDPAISDQVKIFPNPASSILQIQLTNSLHGEHLELYNALGQRVWEQPVDGSRILLPVSGFERGYYLLKIRTDQGTVVKRVLLK